MNSPCLAQAQLAFRSIFRSHPLRAGAALAFLLSLFAPSLVAFTFAGADAMAFEGAMGTACIAGPLLALLGATAFATGDRAAEGLAPLLRSPAAPGAALLASVAGISMAAVIATLLCAGAALVALLRSGSPLSPAAIAGPLAASLAATLAAASFGILLGSVAPRAPAQILAALTAVLLLGGAIPLPATEIVLLSRDAAFGDLRLRVVLFSVLASLLLTSAAVAGTVALLRGKDMVARPRSS